MENEDVSKSKFSDLVRWATTRPQVYVVYLIGLILVWSISFYAGTLNPKKNMAPPASSVSAPQR